ncbi:MAG: HAD-IC family P-type ATPase, partial [Hyphomonadaceae bacterium]|nr:HAD-IC family P-type ATPase [Hyphomonadaceae bacterium]
MTAPAYWSDDLDALMRRLGASASGLSGEEARQRLAAAGPSTPPQTRAADAVRLIARQFASPLVLILVCGSLLAMALREWTEASVILAIVAGSTALGFAQEYRAGRAIDALQRRFALHARVLRDGAEIGVPFHELVTGDVVILSAGDVVPADGRILEASDFLVSEASLTGESFPVEKRPGVAAADAPLSERSNCAFAGGSVRSGFAKLLVCATGEQSLLGAVAKNLQRGEQETEFSRGLRRFGYLLLRVAVLLVVFVLVVNQLLGRPFLESLLFSVALAVGLSPELLPAIVSVTLSAGARRMAKAGVLVRRLEAIENLGEIDVLCTDKTGTLTLGAARLDSALDPQGQPSTRAMDLAFINAGFESGIENPLDRAIIGAGEDQGRMLGETIQGWRKIDEIPYDFQRKRLTIVVARDDQAERLIICKGAFEQVLQICTEIETESGPTPLTPALRAELTARYGAFGRQGQRVLGIAARARAAQADFT